jgi:hypothetical protein
MTSSNPGVKMGRAQSNPYKTGILLLLLTAAALLVHGYHPFAEDAEIYLPGVEKILHPELFPARQEFFASHASLTLFPNLIASSLRITRSPLEAGLFVWYLISIFLLLLACWELSGKCFQNPRARWAGVALVGALFTIPVAGTALYLMDQYLNPRNLAAFAGVFAVTRVLEKKYVGAALWLGFAAGVHPLMAAFAVSFCLLLGVLPGLTSLPEAAIAVFPCLLPLGISLGRSSPAYHEAISHHGYFNTRSWEWYEWLGVIAPVILLYWFSRLARAQQRREVERVCRALIIYALFYLAVMLVVCTPYRLESLERLQPLRSLHLLYIFMFVIAGGFLGEFVLKDRVWRWVVLFVPLCLGMFLAQRSLFSASAHIEWPGSHPKNQWAQAFVWIRANTPVEAGFRCLAERSRLADLSKDSGAVSMFPPLAEEWWAQVQAQQNWKKFQDQDFVRLKTQFGADWVIVPRASPARFNCPYENETLRVCRLP